MTTKSRLLRLAAGFAVAFGGLTILSGARALASMADMGDVVGFVLWFNFLAGFIYVAAGVLMWRRSPHAFPVALALCLTTVFVFAALGLHILGGGAYEPRTVGAMALRSGFWAVMSLAARRLL